MQIAITVDAGLRRCVHIEQQFLEVDTVTAKQQVGNGIVALTLHMHLQSWQQTAQCRLVDGLLVKLCHNRVAKDTKGLHQLLIVSMGIYLHDEVTTLCSYNGGIGIGLQMETYPLRTVGLGGIGHHDVADKTSNIVVHLHVGIEIGRTA